MWRYIIFAIITIGGIVLFLIDQKASKNQDIINKEGIEFKEKQSELNFVLLRQINDLRRQLDLSKVKERLFQIGEIDMSYEEIEAYLLKQTNASNSMLNRALAFYGLDRLDESEKLFIEALKTYPKNEDKRAFIHSYLGELYLRLPGDLPEAKRNSLLAYEYYKEIIKEDDTENLFEFGNITSNLGRILKRETNYKKALYYYNESLLVREKLAKINPKKYLIDLGSIYNNIAVLFRERPDLGDAEKLYLKALKIKREAAKGNINYLPTVATTLNNLGNLYNEEQNNFRKAEIYFKEAIDICQFIVDNGNREYLYNLANYQSGLAFALENLFTQNKNIKYFKESEDWFSKALENFNKIENKEVYYIEYSNCLHNLGRLYKEAKNYQKAEKHYLDALVIRKKLANSKLPFDEVRLADTQLSLALLYTDNFHNKNLALKYANQSQDNYNNNLHFRDSKKWINVSRQIIDFWNEN